MAAGEELMRGKMERCSGARRGIRRSVEREGEEVRWGERGRLRKSYWIGERMEMAEELLGGRMRVVVMEAVKDLLRVTTRRWGEKSGRIMVVYGTRMRGCGKERWSVTCSPKLLQLYHYLYQQQ